jgi:glycosyltransferase involved in cell wall biosynthesis
MADPMPASGNADITAVVPCFNYGAYLHEALESLLAQEGGPPRIVVVDDGSTEPETLAALERVPEGVEVIHKRNEGLAEARNTGYRSTDTPYLIALDADDRMPPGALRAMREALDNEPDVGWAYGTTRFFGDWEGEMRMPPFDPYRMLYRHTIGPVALTRRTLFEDVGGYDSVFNGLEDWEFWLHAIERGWRGRQVDAVTFEYRRHGTTMVVGARQNYRYYRRELRRKHAALYARRAELARQSDLGPIGRLVYRWFWGERPVPAKLEHRIYAVVFRQGRPSAA